MQQHPGIFGATKSWMSLANMAIICPTVTAGTVEVYKKQMERVASFAQRIHIDLMDGKFTRHESVAIPEVWWPVGITTDIHLMYQRPIDSLKQIIELKPSLVIIHAEAEGNFFELAEDLKANHIRLGVTLLKPTAVSTIAPVLELIDHVLIFSGELGSFGGHADLELLDKVRRLKTLKPDLEIGWDGGINGSNAKLLISGGVDVLNVGGFIHRSDDPAHAYAMLKEVVDQNSGQQENN